MWDMGTLLGKQHVTNRANFCICQKDTFARGTNRFNTPTILTKLRPRFSYYAFVPCDGW